MNNHMVVCCYVPINYLPAAVASNRLYAVLSALLALGILPLRMGKEGTLNRVKSQNITSMFMVLVNFDMCISPTSMYLL